MTHSAPTKAGDLDAVQSKLWVEIVQPHEDATERLRELISMGADPELLVERQTWLVTTAVHLAARTGTACWIKAFHDLGFDLDRADPKGNTPAILAVRNVRAEALSVLYEAGVPVSGEYYGVGKGTLLMDAVQLLNASKVCELLLEWGVDVNARDTHGHTAVHLAIDQPDHMRMLLQRKETDVELENHEGNTAAHLACRFSDPLVIVQLLERDANFDHQNLEGVTPMALLLSPDNAMLTDTVLSALAAHSARQAIRDIDSLLHRNSAVSP